MQLHTGTYKKKKNQQHKDADIPMLQDGRANLAEESMRNKGAPQSNTGCCCKLLLQQLLETTRGHDNPEACPTTMLTTFMSPEIVRLCCRTFSVGKHQN